ncbi:hypothetical protein [Candidatus Hecatella orcuttiae]|jgi:small subunit ribosomal protein S24e|uniref:30S ribosomal protein S24e n=1 Tax=Candidatus Hecatella orcuttiae TaxID=1935119 RepID=UPI002867ED2B|nr:hypothetical protein [Candidatus Hecatella orcuttiae]
MSSPKFEVNIVEEKENPLLSRKEAVFEVVHTMSSTPSRKEVREKLAGKLNADPSLVHIVKMETKTRTWKTRGTVHAYFSPEKAEQVIPKYFAWRGLPKSEKEKLLKEKKAKKAAAPKK